MFMIIIQIKQAKAIVNVIVLIADIGSDIGDKHLAIHGSLFGVPNSFITTKSTKSTKRGFLYLR